MYRNSLYGGIRHRRRRRVGGNIFGDIWRGVKKAANWVKDNKVISGLTSLIPHPAGQAVSKITGMVGLGRRRRRRVGGVRRRRRVGGVRRRIHRRRVGGVRKSHMITGGLMRALMSGIHRGGTMSAFHSGVHRGGQRVVRHSSRYGGVRHGGIIRMF